VRGKPLLGARDRSRRRWLRPGNIFAITAMKPTRADGRRAPGIHFVGRSPSAAPSHALMCAAAQPGCYIM